MPLSLPTDSAHLSQPQRQYELFNQPLGQGIPRRSLAIAALSAAVWVPFAWAVLGIGPFSTFGPLVWITPPAAVTILGQLPDPLGRMTILLWYDRAALLLPARRRRALMRNPYLPQAIREPVALRVRAVCELNPGDATAVASTWPPARRRGERSRR